MSKADTAAAAFMAIAIPALFVGGIVLLARNPVPKVMKAGVTYRVTGKIEPPLPESMHQSFIAAFSSSSEAKKFVFGENGVFSFEMTPPIDTRTMDGQVISLGGHELTVLSVEKV